MQLALRLCLISALCLGATASIMRGGAAENQAAAVLEKIKLAASASDALGATKTTVRLKETSRAMVESMDEPLEENDMPASMVEAGFPGTYNKMCRCKACQAHPNDPNACGDPLNVDVSVEVLHLYDIFDVERYAKLDVFMHAKWFDDRLADLEYSGRVSLDEEENFILWTPDLEIRNQKDPAEVTSVSMKVNVGAKRGMVELSRRVMVDVIADFDCWKFPYDRHAVNITVASFSYGARDVLLKKWVKDTYGPKGEEEYPGQDNWEIFDIQLYDYLAPSIFAGEDSYVTTSLFVSRFYTLINVEIMGPLFMICMFTFTALMIEREDGLGERVNIASIGFLTVMGYQYVVTENLPRVSEMLWIHWYLLVCFIFNFLVAFGVVWLHFADFKLGKTPEQIDRQETCMRYSMPLAFLGCCGILLVVNNSTTDLDVCFGGHC